MFEGFHQRNSRKVTLAGAMVAALLVIAKICLHVIHLDPHEDDTSAGPPPVALAAPVVVEDTWHRTTLPGFSLEARETLSPVGNYAQGHVELRTYAVNWRIEPITERASALETDIANLASHGVLPLEVAERDAAITLGGQPAFRTTLKPANAKPQLAYYTECDDRLIELVVDDDRDGKRFAESYRCAPDPAQRASAERPRVVVDLVPGWEFSPQTNKQAYAVYHAADDTVVLAHTIAARDVAVRTATTQFFDGTNTELAGEIAQRGERYIFGATRRGEPGSSMKVVAWRCSPDEVAVALIMSTTRRGAERALPVAMTGRCLGANEPLPTH